MQGREPDPPSVVAAGEEACGMLEFLASNRAALTRLLDLMPLPVFYQDRDGLFLGCNRAFAALFGRNPQDVVGRLMADLVPTEQAQRFRAADAELLAAGVARTYESDLTLVDGDVRHVRFYNAPLVETDGRCSGLLGVLIDITEQVKLTRRLEVLARYDELTGLNNRREGVLQLSALLEHSRRSGRPLSVLILDIDHFKTVNDRYGHEVGDRVLCGVSTALSATLRDYDLCFRLGGEEFVAVLPDTGLQTALLVAERIRQACAEPVTVSLDESGRSVSLVVTVSIGVAAGTGGAFGVDALLRVSDEALYLAKHGGRNRIVASSDGDGSSARALGRQTRENLRPEVQ